MAIDKTLTPQRREIVDSSERDRLSAAGALAIDPRRSRPRYFDGRFLAARDLTADQAYVLARSADLGRVAGWGIVEGLNVNATERPGELSISAGLAVTPSGETVVLPDVVTVDVMSLRNAELLDAHLGLRVQKTAWSRVRTGAFVLCVRPVEYSAHPRRGYPTSIDGERSTVDHDIIEATAVTLVPWPSSHPGSADDVRRALAREIFVAQEGTGLKADLVPLAMLYLDGVGIRWLDAHLVRRAIGAEQEDLFGLGGIPRAVRAAHVRQYRQQLRDVLGTGLRSFSAVEHFDVLPPIGELPAAALNRSDFTEAFFPPAIEVDVSVVPDDELPMILDETLMLPPIDLRADEQALASVSVLVLVPVDRARYRTFKQTLTNVRRTLVPRSLRYARPTTLPVLRQPLISLGRVPTTATLLAGTRFLPALNPALAEPLATLTDAETTAWSGVLDEAAADGDGLFWFVRRPNFNARADTEAAAIDIDVVDGPSIDRRPT